MPRHSTIFIQPDGLFVPVTRSSHVAVVSGGRRWVFVKGQLGIDSQRRLVDRSMRGQAERAYRNIETALRAIGGRLTDVVKFSVYVSRYHPRDAASIVEVREAVFPPGWSPPSTLLIVAGFVIPGALIEVEAIAVLPPERRAPKRRGFRLRRRGRPRGV
jgi:enamine deaminase RidA (YjgF/YER057c/UK114 family)